MKSENSKALIKYKSDPRMHFSRSQSIHITNLEFIGCGGNQVQDIEEFVIKDTMFKGEGGSRTALELIGTTAQIEKFNAYPHYFVIIIVEKGSLVV